MSLALLAKNLVLSLPDYQSALENLEVYVEKLDKKNMNFILKKLKQELKSQNGKVFDAKNTCFLLNELLKTMFFNLEFKEDLEQVSRKRMQKIKLYAEQRKLQTPDLKTQAPLAYEIINFEKHGTRMLVKSEAKSWN